MLMRRRSISPRWMRSSPSAHPRTNGWRDATDDESFPVLTLLCRWGTAMNQSEANKALIREHYDATTNAFKPAAIDRQIAADFVDHGNPGIVGPEGVKTHIKALRAAFPDLSVTIEDIVAEGDLVAVRGTWRGTHQ